MRCTAPGLFLTFRLKGGWSTLDELAGHNINTKEEGANTVDDSKADSSSSSTGSLGLPEPREAHGVIIPLSKEVSCRNDTPCSDRALELVVTKIMMVLYEEKSRISITVSCWNNHYNVIILVVIMMRILVVWILWRRTTLVALQY